MQRPQPIISEADVRLFLQQAPNGKEVAVKMTAAFVIVALFMGAGFFALNSSAYLRLFTTKAEPVQAAATPAPTAAPTATPQAQAEVKAPTIAENSIHYPALNISAPVIWDTPLDEKVMQKELLSGVIQIKGTAKPGDMGFTVITGHSSNYPWIRGSYNTIFAPLAKAQVGQTILVNSQNKEYTYTVSKIYEVKPTDVAILQDSTQTGGLRLVTCTPIGTSLRRLIVEAEQTSPAPSTNKPFSPTVFKGLIPAAR